jgi:hypothetical protein
MIGNKTLFYSILFFGPDFGTGMEVHGQIVVCVNGFLTTLNVPSKEMLKTNVKLSLKSLSYNGTTRLDIQKQFAKLYKIQT